MITDAFDLKTKNLVFEGKEASGFWRLPKEKRAFDLKVSYDHEQIIIFIIIIVIIIIVIFLFFIFLYLFIMLFHHYFHY